jgi:hypothetical protein
MTAILLGVLGALFIVASIAILFRRKIPKQWISRMIIAGAAIFSLLLVLGSLSLDKSQRGHTTPTFNTLFPVLANTLKIVLASILVLIVSKSKIPEETFRKLMINGVAAMFFLIGLFLMVGLTTFLN